MKEETLEEINSNIKSIADTLFEIKNLLRYKFEEEKAGR